MLSLKTLLSQLMEEKRFKIYWKLCMCVHGNKPNAQQQNICNDGGGCWRDTFKKKPSVCTLSEFSLHEPVGVIRLCHCFENNYMEENIQHDKSLTKKKQSKCCFFRLFRQTDLLFCSSRLTVCGCQFKNSSNLNRTKGKWNAFTWKWLYDGFGTLWVQ